MILIIKFFDRFRLNVPGPSDVFPRWAKVSVKDGTLRFKHIDRESAISLIRENGLVATHSDGDGIVYDTPDRSFQKKHRGIRVPFQL